MSLDSGSGEQKRRGGCSSHPVQESRLQRYAAATSAADRTEGRKECLASHAPHTLIGGTECAFLFAGSRFLIPRHRVIQFPFHPCSTQPSPITLSCLTAAAASSLILQHYTLVQEERKNERKTPAVSQSLPPVVSHVLLSCYCTLRRVKSRESEESAECVRPSVWHSAPETAAISRLLPAGSLLPLTR